MKKKKGMKRVFVLFLALTMSLSFFQITSFADEGSVADDPTKEEVLQLEETEETTPSDQTTTSAGSNDETTAAVSDETTDETAGRQAEKHLTSLQTTIRQTTIRRMKAQETCAESVKPVTIHWIKQLVKLQMVPPLNC